MLEIIVKEILNFFLHQSQDLAKFTKLLNTMPSSDQRNFVKSVLKVASKDYLSSAITTEDNSEWWKSDTVTVSAAAALVNFLTVDENIRKGYLISWLTSSSGAGIGDGVAIRRAIVASLTREKRDIETVLDKALQQFGDKLYIKHTPTLQQEGMYLGPG